MEEEARRRCEGRGSRRRAALVGFVGVAWIVAACALLSMSTRGSVPVRELGTASRVVVRGMQAGTIGSDGEDAAGGEPLRGRKLLMLSTSLLVAGLGDGLFALIFLYLVLLLTCCVGCRIDNGYMAYIPLFLVILIITLILVLAPKVPREMLAVQQEETANAVLDLNYIPQTTIIVAVFVGAILGVVLLFVCHCIQPVYVRSLED